LFNNLRGPTLGTRRNRLQLEFVRREGDHPVGQLDLVVGSLEVVALGEFLARLVDGVVDLLQVDLGHNVKTGHVHPPKQGAKKRRESKPYNTKRGKEGISAGVWEGGIRELMGKRPGVDLVEGNKQGSKDEAHTTFFAATNHTKGTDLKRKFLTGGTQTR